MAIPLPKSEYRIENADEFPTPSLLFYPELIAYNTDKAIEYAGGAERIWAHVKTHKSADVLHLLQSKGLRRFKCATIAEAETAALCDAEEILLAYPLIGANISRFIQLIRTYPHSRFWAIGDSLDSLSALGSAAYAADLTIPTLLDVNIGMDRTGGPLEKAVSAYEAFSRLEGLKLRGLHFFSGNFKIRDLAERKAAVEKTGPQIRAIPETLRQAGYPVEAVVLSGTPSLSCYRDYENVFVCPGTAFITDLAYYNTFPDYDFVPAAALLTRVISTPRPGSFTIDLGYKHIASDPNGQRGVILGYEDAQVLFQCEEHWTFQTAPERAPKLGETLYVLPTHICPTIALYPEALTVEKGRVSGIWPITARNLKITI